MFNPNAVVEVRPIDAHNRCLIIDDVLLEPERWQQQAVAHQALFATPSGNAYPGQEMPMPDYVTDGLIEFLRPLCKQHFNVRRMVDGCSRLSMVTQPPEQLKPRQWICHRDRLKISAGQMAIASVIYLFDQPELGGTHFFQPKQTPLATDMLVHDSSVMEAGPFAEKYALQPGFMTDSNAYFERTLTVPAKWNRMIVYSGMVFHSGDIRRPEAMSADPAIGRLTLNGFFTGRLGLA